MTMICFVPCFPWLKSFQAHLTSIFVFFVKEKQKSSWFEKVKRNENLNLTTLTVNYAKDTMAEPTFPTRVGTGGTIWLPGIQVSLSLSLGLSFASNIKQTYFPIHCDYGATVINNDMWVTQPLIIKWALWFKSALTKGKNYQRLLKLLHLISCLSSQMKVKIFPSLVAGENV